MQRVVKKSKNIICIIVLGILFSESIFSLNSYQYSSNLKFIHNSNKKNKIIYISENNYKNDKIYKIPQFNYIENDCCLVLKPICCDNEKCVERKFSWAKNFINDVVYDYSVYYRPENLFNLGLVLTIAAISANSNLDRGINRFWQNKIRSSSTNNFFKPFNELGSFNYVKAYIGTIFLGYLLDYCEQGSVLYNWGYRSLRTLILISPQEVFFSYALGSEKPKNEGSSKWKLFRKWNSPGCSAHAFNGAIPFLTAAMMSDEPWMRYGFYILSTLPGLARINNQNHYFSQVFLGWSLAFLSAKAVDYSDIEGCRCIRFGILPLNKGCKISAGFRF